MEPRPRPSARTETPPTPEQRGRSTRATATCSWRRAPARARPRSLSIATARPPSRQGAGSTRSSRSRSRSARPASFGTESARSSPAGLNGQAQSGDSRARRAPALPGPRQRARLDLDHPRLLPTAAGRPPRRPRARSPLSGARRPEADRVASAAFDEALEELLGDGDPSGPPWSPRCGFPTFAAWSAPHTTSFEARDASRRSPRPPQSDPHRRSRRLGERRGGGVFGRPRGVAAGTEPRAHRGGRGARAGRRLPTEAELAVLELASKRRRRSAAPHAPPTRRRGEGRERRWPSATRAPPTGTSPSSSSCSRSTTGDSRRSARGSISRTSSSKRAASWASTRSSHRSIASASAKQYVPRQLRIALALLDEFAGPHPSSSRSNVASSSTRISTNANRPSSSRRVTTPWALALAAGS